ncbi:MAG: hypothetical protein MI919_43145 [Holophagales bacterium]|nr:hypothetical protein [Holophagales bacterium]
MSPRPRSAWRARLAPLGRLPLVGRFFPEREPAKTARPHGYDLLGELREDLDPTKLPSPKEQVAHASLLESLRALDTRLEVPTVVIAGVDSADAPRPVIAGLIVQSHLRGLHLALGKLVPGKGFRLLRKRVPRSAPGDDTRAPGVDSSPEDLALRIVGAPPAELLGEWYERAASGSDLLLIEAPPLLDSVDAALLARAADGLVLVVEPMSTRQDAFETAVDRARAAGAPPAGLVMSRHREWLPRAILKVLPPYPRSARRRPPSGR